MLKMQENVVCSVYVDYSWNELLTYFFTVAILNADTCDPKDITFLFLKRQKRYFVHWDIDHYNPSCSFNITFSNCSNPLTKPCRLNVNMSNIQNKQARASLDQCVGTNILYPDGAIIDIRWDNQTCIEQDTSCSKKVFIPADVNTTGQL